MNKIIKNVLIVIGILGIVFVILYFLVVKGLIKVNIFPNARTLYTGYVKIEPVSLSNIKTKLETSGCRAEDYDGQTIKSCRYQSVEEIPFEKKAGIVIYPYGFGWGPMSFYVTEDMVWSTKDIPGSPDLEKFKQEVRRDISVVGGVVRAKEDSWKITKLKYPWTVEY